MKSHFEISREAEERAEQIAASTERLKRWLEFNHPEIAHNGEAGVKAFKDDMGDAFLTATDEDFEYSLKTTTTQFSRQRVPTELEVKAEIVEKIAEILTASDGSGRNDANVKTFRGKAKYMSLAELTARLDELTRKINISAMPHADRKQILVDARRDTSFPRLPKSIVRPGTVRAVPLDSAYLRSLDAFDLKRMLRLYGEQVNLRLQGKD